MLDLRVCGQRDAVFSSRLAQVFGVRLGGRLEDVYIFTTRGMLVRV